MKPRVGEPYATCSVATCCWPVAREVEVMVRPWTSLSGDVRETRQAGLCRDHARVDIAGRLLVCGDKVVAVVGVVGTEMVTSPVLRAQREVRA